ncbi:calcium/proton exchanger [Leptolyngbya sp. FACHB-261]|nr:calcium/proton exchanger [Leptolyngbya sp. FACHB-261]
MSVKAIIFKLPLLFIPISIAGHFLHWSPLTIFLTSALAILPLARLMSTATEEIALVAGPTIGGLLNATFGNATELIIALTALNAGLIAVVKASLTGTIISNLLLVMGLSAFLGGLRYKEQEFQPTVARVNASTMNLAVIALLLPAAVVSTTTGIEEEPIRNLSIAVAVVLILVYGLSLLFSIKTHSYLYDVSAVEHEEDAAAKEKVNLPLWIGVLFGVTLLVAVESELLVGGLEEATKQLGLSTLFTGVVLLPLVGSAAEYITAVTVAMKNKMDLAVSVAVGSSLQISLFVAPVLVLTGWVIGQPMDLNFNPFELVGVTVAVLITNSISSDGRSNWLEGALLLAAYAILGLAFYFHPVIPGM